MPDAFLWIGLLILIVGVIGVSLHMLFHRALKWKTMKVLSFFFVTIVLAVIIGGFSSTLGSPWARAFGGQATPLSSIPTGGEQPIPDLPTDVLTGAAVATDCPDDKSTDFALNVLSFRNSSGEGFDVTYSLFKVRDGKIISKHSTEPTDTTAPAATAVTCSEHWVARIQAADGDQGDNTKAEGILDVSTGEYVDEIKNGQGQVIQWIDDNGDLNFIADKEAVDVTIGVTQHGVLQIKCNDNDASGNALCEGDDACGNFETMPLQFNSTNNASTKVISSDSDLIDLTCTVKTTRTDTVFGDRGWCVMQDANPDGTSTQWDDATFYGSSSLSNPITETSSLLSNNWKKEFSNDYEAAWCLSDPITSTQRAFRWTQQPIDGGNPADEDDINMTLIAFGAFESSNTVSIKVDLVDDTQTTTDAIYTVQDFAIDIS